MKYKRIRRLDILGRKFKVYHRKVKDADGECCPTDEIIMVDPKAENKPRTIYHEMGHGIIFSGALYEALGGNQQLIEIICEQFSRVFDENFEYTPRKRK